jgi:hypothetical protein
MIKLIKSEFNSNPYWVKEAKKTDILENPLSVNLFDQNGYNLTLAEQVFAETNDSDLVKRRQEIVIRKDWLIEEKYCGAHINHSDLLERKGYDGDALNQLNKYGKKNPMLYKILKMKPKWGIDISIDYVSENNVFEVFHYEWDSFNFNEVLNKKKEIEDLVLSKDWDEEAEKLLKLKDKWYNLPFFEQTKWKTDYFGIEPEKFKNVIWE